MTEQHQRPPPHTSISLDLTALRQPKVARTLIDLIEHADLNSATLRAIRDAAAARLTQPEIATFSSLRAKHEAELRGMMKERVWGVAKPSVRSFRQYLKSLQNLSETSYAEKQELVKTVNYWKKELKVKFRYGDVACTLKAVPAHKGIGAFQLRETGSDQRSFYGNVMFPALLVQSIDPAS